MRDCIAQETVVVRKKDAVPRNSHGENAEDDAPSSSSLVSRCGQCFGGLNRISCEFVGEYFTIPIMYSHDVFMRKGFNTLPARAKGRSLFASPSCHENEHSVP